ncbi:MULTISPECIES: SPOR domain-containing protein [Maribacter]|uniref:SPOR domain-containing protein n=1 Tax=Maribacter flavus TaxID=1658664 RepID=A0ABU7IE72_9FLAO|nr:MULTISPECIES: SPOR domain-containing protein [Maribacter]MDC6404103.1 SPOR domain-containing protein [Maribacter sp. PR66]MEE1971244.1 SPOR domain-containing protein [Maribacter flavus]
MVVEHYISELLYRYNCVAVPNFGAFLTQHTSARINDITNTFFAPAKSISFNEQLISNDGLLVSYIAEAEKSSFEDILSKIETITKQWKSTLNAGEKLSLKNIGLLWNNAENRIQFQPYYEVNYLTSSFGLSSFKSIPVTREVLKEEVEAIEEKIPFIISPEKREKNRFRPYLKYAAILLLAISAGFTGYQVFNNGFQSQQVVREDAKMEVERQIQEATFFNTAPLELPTVSVDAVSTAAVKADEAAKHHIVAGAFRVKANADRKIASLQSKGYKAAYYGTNAYGLHVVTYDRFTDPKEALTELRRIKGSESKDAWLLSEK